MLRGSKTLINNHKWIDKAIAADEFPEHDFYIPIGSLMNVLKYNPNHHEQTFPYIEVGKDKITKNDTDQVNIGLVFETDRNSNSHDDESIEPRLFKIYLTKNTM